MTDYEVDRISNLLSEIETIRTRYIIQRDRVAEAEYIEKLMFVDYVNKCKSPKNDYDYLNGIIEKAFHEDKRGSNFKFIQDKIRQDFFNNDKSAKLDKIICCGYEGYAYEHKIKYKGCVFVIEIPMLNAITTENFYKANRGMIHLGIQEGSFIDYFAASYSVEEIRKALDKYIEENIKQE